MVVNLKTGTSDYFARTETLTRYYEDIRKYNVLSSEEEVEYFLMLKNGSDAEKNFARKQLVNSNQRFVVAIAKKFGTNDNVLDLISEGNIGLMEAIDKFDVTRGIKFATYAVWYIRRAINLYNINYGDVVTKSNISKTYHVISQATNKFLQREFRQPTLEELKEILLTEYDVDIKEVEDILDTHYISIDESDQKDDDNANVGDMLLFNSTSASRNLYERESDCEFNKKLITNMLQKLTPKEQEIIKMVFGIGYDREYELQEIGAKLGLTTERVRQLKFSVIDKLKLDYKSAINRV